MFSPVTSWKCQGAYVLSHEGTGAVPGVGVAREGFDGISHSLFRQSIASPGYLP